MCHKDGACVRQLYRECQTEGKSRSQPYVDPSLMISRVLRGREKGACQSLHGGGNFYYQMDREVPMSSVEKISGL
jgi:hypothetical protein